MSVGSLYLISTAIFGAALMHIFITVNIFEYKRNNNKKEKTKNE